MREERASHLRGFVYLLAVITGVSVYAALISVKQPPAPAPPVRVATVAVSCPTPPVAPRSVDALAALDWTAISSGASKGRATFDAATARAYISLIQPFVERDPDVAARVTSRPASRRWTIDCADPRYAGVLTGAPRNRTARVYDFVTFGMELDILEIRLNELDGIVDRFVVHEATVTHRYARKDLILARNMRRYERFRDRIVHLVSDDAAVEPWGPRQAQHGDTMAWVDNPQRVAMWQRYVAGYGMPDNDTVLIHGDVDEIPDGRAVDHLRHCEVRQWPLRFGGPFYIMNFDWIPSDYRTLDQPAAMRAVDLAELPGFWRGMKINGRMPGAAHLNRLLTPDGLAYKEAALAEATRVDLTTMRDPSLIEPYARRGLRTALPNDNAPPEHPSAGSFVPWFADCNRDRFPYMFPLRDGNAWTDASNGTRLIADNCIVAVATG
jgi:hypothetical protein